MAFLSLDKSTSQWRAVGKWTRIQAGQGYLVPPVSVHSIHHQLKPLPSASAQNTIHNLLLHCRNFDWRITLVYKHKTWDYHLTLVWTRDMVCCDLLQFTRHGKPEKSISNWSPESWRAGPILPGSRWLSDTKKNRPALDGFISCQGTFHTVIWLCVGRLSKWFELVKWCLQKSELAKKWFHTEAKCPRATWNRPRMKLFT